MFVLQIVARLLLFDECHDCPLTLRIQETTKRLVKELNMRIRLRMIYLWETNTTIAISLYVKNFKQLLIIIFILLSTWLILNYV